MKSEARGEKINKFCGKCLRTCRQSAELLLIDCPRFLPRPFRIETPKFKQLDLFSETEEKGNKQIDARVKASDAETRRRRVKILGSLMVSLHLCSSASKQMF